MKPTTPRTMEERRAVLGCFLITSMYARVEYIPIHMLIAFRISSFLQKMDPLRWTPHMDECLQFIDEAKDCHNDAILVQLVRLQLIVEKVGGRPVDEAAMESFEQIREALPFQSQLHDIKVQLISEPKPSGMLPYNN
jgi:hypothetical protein